MGGWETAAHGSRLWEARRHLTRTKRRLVRQDPATAASFLTSSQAMSGCGMIAIGMNTVSGAAAALKSNHPHTLLGLLHPLLPHASQNGRLPVAAVRLSQKLETLQAQWMALLLRAGMNEPRHVTFSLQTGGVQSEVILPLPRAHPCTESESLLPRTFDGVNDWAQQGAHALTGAWGRLG